MKIESQNLRRKTGTVQTIVGDSVVIQIDNGGVCNAHRDRCPGGVVVGTRLSVILGTPNGYIVAGL